MRKLPEACFAAMDARLVVSACDAYIAKRRAEKADAIEREIQRRMAIPRKTFFGRQLENMTRDEAEKSLDEEHEFLAGSFRGQIERIGLYWLEKAGWLRSLAGQSADGLVYVSEEMAFITKYMPVNDAGAQKP